MITQRAEGIREATNQRILLLDDDVVLDPRFAEVLIEAMKNSGAACVVPYWPDGWPKKLLSRFLYRIWGMAVPRRTGGIKYLRGGGYFYPLRPPPPMHWETHGGAGAAILMDREFAVRNEIYGFKELQKVGPWAIRDDGALILDVARKGGKALMVAGANFHHLGGTTRLMSGRLYMRHRAEIFGHYLFWRQFIRPTQLTSTISGWMGLLGLLRYLSGVVFLGVVSSVRARTLEPIRGILDGMRMLLRDVNSRPARR
jgi:hypothetical protein